MEERLYVKNNILYLEAGYFFVGDIEKIISLARKALPKLKPPFQGIITFEKTVEMDSLIHPEERAAAKELFDMITDAGRDLAVWVIPENCILCKELQKNFGIDMPIRTAGSVDEAERIVKDYRESQS